VSTSVEPRDDMDARIRARRARVRAEAVKRRQRRTLSLFFLLLVVAVVAVTLRSPLFEISAIEVRGVGGERAEVVRQAAAIQQGQHLLTAPLSKAQASVERLPWVKAAVVRRAPPSTVAVQVTPRRPLLTVEAGGAAWKIDDEAVVVDGGRVAGAPVITVGEADRSRSGGDAARLRRGAQRERAGGQGGLDRPELGAAVQDRTVRDAVRVHAGLPAWLRGRVTAYHVEAPRDLWLRVRVPAEGDGSKKAESVKVRFGTSRDLALKAEVIRVLLPQAVEREGDVDVRAPANPVVVESGQAVTGSG
jgi:hypothetical protein